jgi:ABC-type branched-subunit amino acid transport system substrate-binding protein
MKVAEAEGVPFVGPMAGSPTLRRPHARWVLPVRAEHRDEFAALMRYGRSVGLRRVAFLHSATDVGRQHLANLKLVSAAVGVEVVAALPIGGEVTDEQLEAHVKALRQAGADPTREGLVRAVEAAGALDLGGISVQYKPGDHAGSAFVDLAIVARDGRFLQ